MNSQVHDPNLLPREAYERPKVEVVRFGNAFDKFYNRLSKPRQEDLETFIAGIGLLWYFVKVMLLRKIDAKTFQEIQHSPTLRGAMILALIIVGLVLAHALKGDWPVVDCAFLILQAYRLVMFFGSSARSEDAQ